MFNEAGLNIEINDTDSAAGVFLYTFWKSVGLLVANNPDCVFLP